MGDRPMVTIIITVTSGSTMQIAWYLFSNEINKDLVFVACEKHGAGPSGRAV
jgi:hypothetical protein